MLPGSETNLNFLQENSNDIALIWVPGLRPPKLAVHAPSNVTLVDLSQKDDLLGTGNWKLSATLNHILDPLFVEGLVVDPNAVFAAGNSSQDLDGDAIPDVKEFFLSKTDSTLIDTDGDGINDGQEILTYGLNANSTDTDGDGLSDAQEVALGLNPNSADRRRWVDRLRGGRDLFRANVRH